MPFISLVWGYNSTNAPVSIMDFFFSLWYEIMILTVLYAINLLLLMLGPSLILMLQTGGWHVGHKYSYPIWRKKRDNAYSWTLCLLGDQAVTVTSVCNHRLNWKRLPCAATLLGQSSSQLNLCGDFTTEGPSNDQIQSGSLYEEKKTIDARWSNSRFFSFSQHRANRYMDEIQ